MISYRYYDRTTTDKCPSNVLRSSLNSIKFAASTVYVQGVRASTKQVSLVLVLAKHQKRFRNDLMVLTNNKTICICFWKAQRQKKRRLIWLIDTVGNGRRKTKIIMQSKVRSLLSPKIVRWSELDIFDDRWGRRIKQHSRQHTARQGRAAGLVPV